MTKKPNKPEMPKEHPAPFQSPLWNHLEEIRELRRSRKMWREIAVILEQKHGLKVSHRTVRNFFVRSRSPKRRVPAGFEEALGVVPKQPAPAPAQPAAGPAPSPRASSLSPDDPGFAEAEPDDPTPVKTRKLKELREQREREQREREQQRRPNP